MVLLITSDSPVNDVRICIFDKLLNSEGNDLAFKTHVEPGGGV